ncbi:MAG: hypothetical protein KC933_05775 [Myxococcales bacterium]|nr:hypothetical protein [Myxococcales bacterium]
MRRWLYIGVLALCGCGAASGASVTGAAVMGTLAAASAVASRASGGCYAECTHGTICNAATGMCERTPCGGACQEGETCDAVTDTCLRARPSVPVQVMRMVAWGTWWWPFDGTLMYFDPYREPPDAQARPPTADPRLLPQGGLPPGM